MRNKLLSWASNLKQFTTNYQFLTLWVPPLSPPKLHPALALDKRYHAKHATLGGSPPYEPSLFYTLCKSTPSPLLERSLPRRNQMFKESHPRTLNPINVWDWAVVAPLRNRLDANVYHYHINFHVTQLSAVPRQL